MISKDDVKNVASLARIHLQDHEIEPFTKNLEDILHYIEKLEKLDVEKVTPTSHVFDVENVFRPDTVEGQLEQKDALKFSVEQQDGFFKVPKVIE